MNSYSYAVNNFRILSALRFFRIVELINLINSLWKNFTTELNSDSFAVMFILAASCRKIEVGKKLRRATTGIK